MKTLFPIFILFETVLPNPMKVLFPNILPPIIFPPVNKQLLPIITLCAMQEEDQL